MEEMQHIGYAMEKLFQSEKSEKQSRYQLKLLRNGYIGRIPKFPKLGKSCEKHFLNNWKGSHSFGVGLSHNGYDVDSRKVLDNIAAC